MSGVVPNKNRKTKTAPDGVPYPDGFNDWSNKKRLDWLQEHKAKAAAAAPAGAATEVPAEVPTEPCGLCGRTDGTHNKKCTDFRKMTSPGSLVGKALEL